MKRWEISLILGMVIAVVFTSFGAFGAQCREVSKEVLRLHVLANSDSEEDQALKLKVRDAVLAGTCGLFDSADAGKEALITLTQDHLADIEAIAQRTLRENGSADLAKAEVVNMYFETRDYETFVMPAGYYDAVRITIGTGQGKNWWCVMFPPMCIPAAQASPLPLEDQLLHLGEETQYIPKFAVVELIESLLAEDSPPSQPIELVDIPS